MKTFFTPLLAVCMAFSLASCNNGSSAPAPSDMKAVAGDGVVTLTWSMTPGVDYWLFYAASDSISTSNWTSLPSAKYAKPVSSPYVVTGLTNGTTYSFTVNGRKDGGPGGEGTPSKSAVPRLSGNAWNAEANLANDLYGIARGSGFVAVGANGSVATSPDGKSWANQNSGTKSSLNAITYSSGNYIAAGVGGTVLSSTDGVTWKSQNSGTTEDLYGLMSNGNFYLAVGANGKLISSTGGTSWATITSGTTSALYGATYGNGRYVVVGAKGTILTSTDAQTWQSVTPLSNADLKGVAYGMNGTTGTFVAMGEKGTILTSTDGLTWSVQTSLASMPNINAVTYRSQFIAVGDAGVIMTSTNATEWKVAPITPNTTSNLRAVSAGNYGYVSVGVSGVNLNSY